MKPQTRAGRRLARNAERHRALARRAMLAGDQDLAHQHRLQAASSGHQARVVEAGALQSRLRREAAAAIKEATS